jgi:NAD(P)-dependent dehydrogenase (short-subunit alcohol dehydrogenase family)
LAVRLANQVVIVTGAARGIGRAIATRMAQEGARTVLADREAEVLAAAVSDLQRQGLDVLACVADVTTPAGNESIVAATRAAYGRVDVFHANAGVAPFHDLLETNPAEIERTVSVNLTGAIHGCAAVLPTMVAQRSGVILLTASIAAYVGDPSVPVYSATKGGLTALCRSIAVRHGPDGIRCNTICPGDVRTQMLEDYLARSPDPAAARAEMVGRYPLRRLAEPEEIANVAVFLASTDAAWITGTDIVIDGGLTARCY